MLDVCLLGTGGMMPLPNRWLTALLIRFNGRMVLIDCGEGTQIPIKMLGWGFKNIDAILFTHYHGDHIAGLPGLLLTLGNSGRDKPLTLMGPPGLKTVVEGLTVISPELPYEIILKELSDQTFSENLIYNISIKSIPAMHSLPCLAYCIEIKRQGQFDVERAKKLNIPRSCWKTLQKGQEIAVEGNIIYPEMVLGGARPGIKVSYCTDTRPTEELYGFVENSDLLICEGIYGDENSFEKAVAKKHMIFREAAQLARGGNAKELWLTHYSPSLIDPEEYIEAARSVFKNTVAGRDLFSKTIKWRE